MLRMLQKMRTIRPAKRPAPRKEKLWGVGGGGWGEGERRRKLRGGGWGGWRDNRVGRLEGCRRWSGGEAGVEGTGRVRTYSFLVTKAYEVRPMKTAAVSMRACSTMWPM